MTLVYVGSSRIGKKGILHTYKIEILYKRRLSRTWQNFFSLKPFFFGLYLSYFYFSIYRILAKYHNYYIKLFSLTYFPQHFYFYRGCNVISNLIFSTSSTEFFIGQSTSEIPVLIYELYSHMRESLCWTVISL